ncbi:sigma-70 family RNA polymerase sigma factor [Umezawaea sp.]|uniref:RNA polymerase sigma factor n=1 Tax=Umezawaea sp. TaxID=1955258 RepID=UPI002ED2646C
MSDSTPDNADTSSGGGEPPDDAVLWSGGDRESFDVVFERHVEAVWNHAYRLTASRERAYDVTSATFVTAWRSRADVTPVGPSALPLLCATAGDVVRAGHRRSRGSATPQPVDEHADAVVHRVDDDSRLREVIDVVRRLPRAQREVAELCLLGGLPVADAAVHLRVSEETARSRLALALARLAEDVPADEPLALPPAVRGRLRAEVERGVARRAVPGRLLAVAAVVLLLAGTVLVLRQVPDAPHPVAAVGGSLDREAAAVALDRCWAAVRQRGLADRFPDRSLWTPSFTAGDSQIGVVAARADGKPLFCQTTPTTVTVTDPNAAPDSGTAAVLFSREGVVAGVTDVGWSRIALKGTGPHGSVLLKAESGDHLFVGRTGVNLAGTRISVNEIDSEDPTAVRELAAPAPPAVLVRDRSDGPAPDRASDAGSALGDCLARSSRPLPDPDSYRPGALVTYPGGRLVLGRSANSLVTCRSDEERTEAVRTLLVNSGAPAVMNVLTVVEGDRTIFGGELRPEVSTMEISLGDGPPRPVTVADRTFAFLVPPFAPSGPDARPRPLVVHAVARDANGVQVYERSWNR